MKMTLCIFGALLWHRLSSELKLKSTTAAGRGCLWITMVDLIRVSNLQNATKCTFWAWTRRNQNKQTKKRVSSVTSRRDWGWRFLFRCLCIARLYLHKCAIAQTQLHKCDCTIVIAQVQNCTNNETKLHKHKCNCTIAQVWLHNCSSVLHKCNCTIAQVWLHKCKIAQVWLHKCKIAQVWLHKCDCTSVIAQVHTCTSALHKCIAQVYCANAKLHKCNGTCAKLHKCKIAQVQNCTSAQV